MDSNTLINDIMNEANNGTFNFDPYGTLDTEQNDKTENVNINPDSAPELNIHTDDVITVQAERVKKTQPQTQENVQQNIVQPVQQTNQSTQNVIKTSIDDLSIKKSYTDQEWEKRELVYVSECNKINVNPTNLNSSEITVAAGKIDAILTPLMIDNVYNQRQCTIYESQLKISEQMAYNSVKSSLTAQNIKATVNEVESMVVKTIYDTKTFEEGINIYDAINRYRSRYIFTKQIIDLLNGKKDLLITFSAMLKVENTVTNFTPNVPTGNQINNMRG
jgi:hypothetical protein